jgi:large subunit ribosomal protein L9
VNNATVAEYLEKNGIEIEKKRIDVPSHNIKMPGTYDVKIKLYDQESAVVKLVVTAENQGKVVEVAKETKAEGKGEVTESATPETTEAETTEPDTAEPDTAEVDTAVSEPAETETETETAEAEAESPETAAADIEGDEEQAEQQPEEENTEGSEK